MSMTSPAPAATRSADHARFVAFAFAGADILVEVNADGIVTFADGACQARFGRGPDSFVGGPVRAMVAATDRDSLDCALSMLATRGRLAPMTIRLANPARSQLALAGLRVAMPDGATRLCLTFALPPAMAEPAPITSARGLARAAEERMRLGEPAALEMLEIVNHGAPPEGGLRGAVGSMLDAIVPSAIAGELAPGRFGLLDESADHAGLGDVAAMLERALQAKGVDASVQSSRVTLEPGVLTVVQKARALRQALAAFARSGPHGLAAEGFAQGLTGYMERATRQAKALRQHIAAGKFTLAYQPIVRLADRSVHHYEALIRPEPLEGVSMAPQAFVALAESVGLAPALDLAVAERACAAAARCRQRVAFNMSSQSAQLPAFRAKLLEMLSRSEALAFRLVLVEMTETAEVEDVEAAAATAQALRDLEIPFCLDDFGAGAADVRMLRALGADFLKLDGSYVAGVRAPGRSRAFAAAIVEMARAAGAEVVAEQIERAEDSAALGQIGVGYGQGWLFGRAAPLPAHAVTAAGKRADAKESWG